MATEGCDLDKIRSASPERKISPTDTGAVEAAEELRTVLAQRGIAADVHDGYGLALVSVWVGLIVWCRGDRFWWRTGWNPRQHRPVYAWHPAAEPLQAAHRIALRYAELRKTPSPPESTSEGAP